MKLTLLDIVQDTLSALDSDEVNSISDTVESNQVARIVRRCYNNIKARSNLPELRVLFTLQSSDEGSSPVLMLRPDNINRIEWIKYNVRIITDTIDNYRYVSIIPIEQFLEMTNQFNTDETNVDTFQLDDTTFKFLNDRHPVYCTVVKDLNIVFDSYYQTLDTTLQESKTICCGAREPAFEMLDTFIPDLDEPQVSLLMNECISLAYLELKQSQHPYAERESRRGWSSMQNTKNLVKPIAMDQFADFGRIAGSGRSRAFPFRTIQ